MTRDRMYGSDTPFAAWIRRQDQLDSVQQSMTVSDQDFLIQRYRTTVDKIGTRDIQSMMLVEEKTRGASLSASQAETLFFQHQCCRSKQMRKRIARSPIMLWHFGVSIVRFSGTNPDDSGLIHWGRFIGSIMSWRSITRTQLIGLLSFNLDADSLLPVSYRRRHAETIREEKTPLGFVAKRRYVS